MKTILFFFGTAIGYVLVRFRLETVPEIESPETEGKYMALRCEDPGIVRFLWFRGPVN